ncbi:H/ACA ribonucleoprotein complex non-core subunit NAF1 [Candoia aspera]|uniref:H/ACA ribonucleoprotein complex non-core subunit NAF1 n=1 Tax=Candoia aspera TaxID=51853 RepID=UPI002FD85E97
MDASSALLADGDSSLAGSIVAEQLQTLKVACEGSPNAAAACPQGPALKEGEDQVPLSPKRLGREVSANCSELPQEPGPPWVAPKGGGVEENAPHPGLSAEEKPAPPGNGNGRKPPGTGEEQTWPPGEHPQAAEAPSEREEEHRPPEEMKAGHQPSSSALLGGSSELKNGGLNCQTAPVGPEGQEGLSKGTPAGPERERGSLAMESCRGSKSSSESESDSDADSSSSISSSSSCPPMLSEDDDQQDKNENKSCATGKKSELSKEPVPVEDIMIILPESVELMPFGKVSSIIEHLVIIESQKGLPPVNEDTVLFKEDRHSVGKIFEIFGPVSHPFYVLQFNSPEHIQSKGIKIKDAVYFAPSVESFTQYIFPEKLKQEKGSDASWKNDEEPPPEAMDFSDDEKERAAKLQKKSQNVRRKKPRSQQNDSNDNGNYQPRRQYPSEYSGGYCRGQPMPRFSWGSSPRVSPFPRFYRQHNVTPQYYSSDCAELRKPPTFCQQQRLESMRRHQYSFPPPSFETVASDTNFPPPPPSVAWGWPPGCAQNTYEPLLSMLSLPPPPPPPPPPTAPNTGNSP